MKNEYSIVPVYKKKLFGKKTIKGYNLLNYISNRDGFGVLEGLGFRKEKGKIELLRDKYEKFDKNPMYKVFKLGSGEYEICQKDTYFSHYGDGYHSIFKYDNERVFYRKVEDACDALLKYEKIANREIREPVDCV